jgi:DNA-binding NarL/FixJ family response regulator
MIRLLIADNNTLVRHGIRHIISACENILVISEAKSGWDTIDVLSKMACDIALINIRVPGPNIIDLIKRMRRDYPFVNVITIGGHNENEMARRIIQAGSAGYITKNCEPDELLAAIHEVSQGGRYIAPCVAANIIFSQGFLDEDGLCKKLSDREYQVLELLADGKNNMEIANSLNLSNKTVSTYKTRIMNKLGMTSSAEMLRYIVNHDLFKK